MLGFTNTTNVTLVFRRMAGGQSLEEVMAGLAEEAGLDKFSDIVDHFLGRITVEKIESEDTPEDD